MLQTTNISFGWRITPTIAQQFRLGSLPITTSPSQHSRPTSRHHDPSAETGRVAAFDTKKPLQSYYTELLLQSKYTELLDLKKNIRSCNNIAHHLLNSKMLDSSIFR